MDKRGITKEILQLMDSLESGECMRMPNAQLLAEDLSFSLHWAWDGKISFDQLIDEAWEVMKKMNIWLYGSFLGDLD